MSALPDSITLVMRSYNEAWALGDTLKGVYSQDYSGTIELIVIDSGSTDGSHDIIRSYEPKEFIVLEPGTYVPGKVLNQGLKLASHEWVVFLNSDATPANAQWLSSLLKCATEAPKCGTAFSRQIPRANCQAVFANDYNRCFGPNRESINWDHFFSMVSCVVNKPIWEKYPIHEDLQYAEDDEWSRRLKKAGYDICFSLDSVVIHSHNYTAAEAYERAKGDAIAVAHAGNVSNVNRRWLRHVFLPAIKDTLRDFKYCCSQGKLSQLPHAFSVRYQQRLGNMHGYKEGFLHV